MREWIRDHLPKGSTVIIAFMYATWVGYIAAQVWVHQTCSYVSPSGTYTSVWLPSEVTYGTAALFIAETVSLARLKMAKEGYDVKPKKQNTFLSKLGLTGLEDFDEDAVNVAAKHAKEATDEGKTAKPQVLGDRGGVSR